MESPELEPGPEPERAGHFSDAVLRRVHFAGRHFAGHYCGDHHFVDHFRDGDRPVPAPDRTLLPESEPLLPDGLPAERHCRFRTGLCPGDYPPGDHDDHYRDHPDVPGVRHPDWTRDLPGNRPVFRFDSHFGSHFDYRDDSNDHPGDLRVDLPGVPVDGRYAGRRVLRDADFLLHRVPCFPDVRDCPARSVDHPGSHVRFDGAAPL